ncbi:MAG: hypothetical protein RIC95_05235 [Vicingaceae bacterium]
MSEKNLNRLKKLIQNLRTEEKRLALKHLSAYDTHNSGQKTKMRHLCKVILKDSDIQYERIKELVSKNANSDAFNQLIKRTIERIRESLILDVNIMRKGNYSIVFQKKFQIRKQIIECKILGGRGLTLESSLLIEKLIKEAKRYELFDEILELLRMKQDTTVNLEGLKAYEHLENEILHYENIRDYYLEARKTINYYHAKINFKASSKSNRELMQSTKERLEEYAKQSNSVNISSMAYLVAMDYYEYTEQYEDNYHNCLAFLKLIRSKEIIRSENREMYVIGKLIKNQMLNHKFNSAADFIQSSQKINIKSKNRLYYEIIVSKCFNEFYLGDLMGVANSQSKLDEFPIAKTELESTKIFYYKAMYYFSKEEFRQANLLLQNLPLLEKDKEGWNVWLKIMRILSSIELLRLELIDYDIANFQKYMQRIERKHELSKRDKQIVKVLHVLDRNDFDFKATFKEVEPTLVLLSSKDGEYRWKPLSPEIVLFHDWFYSKLHDKPYKPNMERYKALSES